MRCRIDHAVGLAAHSFRQLAALVVTHVSRGRADEAGDRELLHVLGHVYADDIVLVVKKLLCQSLGQLRLAYAGGAKEEEGADGPLGVGDAGPGAEDGLGDPLHRLVLTDKAAVELIVQMQQLLPLALSENASMEEYYRVRCSRIRMDRESGSGAVSGPALENAFGGKISTPALMINALGEKDPRQIEERSVYLDDSAVEWIIASGVRLLLSDIYESQALEGVFLKLFSAGVTCVCMPRRMSLVKENEFLLSVIFMNVPGVTQIPCRILAECGQ